MGAKAFSSLMKTMKSEPKNPALEAALTMKSTMVADLEASIHEFEGTASLLDRHIKAEEAHTRIEDPAHFAYSNFAKSARQRRDNLLASAAVLKVKLYRLCENQRTDDEGTPHVGPLALGLPGRDLVGRALGMRDARLDDEGTPHVGPLALGSPGRDRTRQALDMRNAREDDEPPPPQGRSPAQPRRARLGRLQHGGRDTSSSGVGAVDVARGALHPAAQRLHAPGDAALYHVRQARGEHGGGAPPMSPSETTAFNQANQHYQDSHMQGHAPTPDQSQGEGVHRGWSPQARIGAARARGAQNLPYGGDPTQAPDYVEPKGGK